MWALTQMLSKKVKSEAERSVMLANNYDEVCELVALWIN